VVVVVFIAPSSQEWEPPGKPAQSLESMSWRTKRQMEALDPGLYSRV
jgi:hypothetical protein